MVDTALVEVPNNASVRTTLSHERWAELCFKYILAEHRGSPPLMCSLDDLLPLALIPKGLIESTVLDTLQNGRTTSFIAYGVGRQARTIPLRGTPPGSRYFNVDDPSIWQDTKEYKGRWAFMRPFIEALPFQATGRAIIMFSNRVGRGVLHFDHDKPTIQHEFVWLKLTSEKQLFVRYGSKDYYTSSSAYWFDSRHIHQADEGAGLEVSMRVDGIFTSAFRQRVVERYATALGLDALPFVMAPDPSFRHPERYDWQRLFKPRHYAHYFALLATQFARTLRWRRKDIAVELGRALDK